MARRIKLPSLASTARFYERRTRRMRLASPGIERYRPKRPHLLRWVAAALLALVLLAALCVRLALP
jgi:hypothetical protein